MAFDSNTATIPSSFQILITEKLNKKKLHVVESPSPVAISPIRAVQMEGLLTGAEAMPAQTIVVNTSETTSVQPNSEYARWVSHDQTVLGYLLVIRWSLK